MLNVAPPAPPVPLQAYPYDPGDANDSMSMVSVWYGGVYADAAASGGETTKDVSTVGAASARIPHVFALQLCAPTLPKPRVSPPATACDRMMVLPFGPGSMLNVAFACSADVFRLGEYCR